MTICNMSIEMGARGGMIAPDKTTFDYLKGREFAPQGKEWDEAVERWSKLRSDDDAVCGFYLQDFSNSCRRICSAIHISHFGLFYSISLLLLLLL